jgi:hypothetical protein
MAPRVGSFTRMVTQLIKVYEKKEKFKSILTFRDCKERRHMQKEKFVVHEKMDPCYSSRGLS